MSVSSEGTPTSVAEPSDESGINKKKERQDNEINKMKGKMPAVNKGSETVIGNTKECSVEKFHGAESKAFKCEELPSIKDKLENLSELSGENRNNEKYSEVDSSSVICDTLTVKRNIRNFINGTQTIISDKVSIKPEVNILTSTYIMWENSSNLCWLDSAMALLVHNHTLREVVDLNGQTQIAKVINYYNEAISMVNDVAYKTLEIRLISAKEKLKAVQKSAHSYLQPILKYLEGEPDSAFCALYNFLTEDKKVKSHFDVDFTCARSCEKCKMGKLTKFKKPIITLPNIKVFEPASPTFISLCPTCKEPEQKITLIYDSLPQCLIFHFENGAGEGDLQIVSFFVNSRQYEATGVITLEKSLDFAVNHFVTWVRDPASNKWLECNDLSDDLLFFSNVKPYIELKDIHIIVFETFDNCGTVTTNSVSDCLPSKFCTKEELAYSSADVPLIDISQECEDTLSLTEPLKDDSQNKSLMETKDFNQVSEELQGNKSAVEKIVALSESNNSQPYICEYASKDTFGKSVTETKTAKIVFPENCDPELESAVSLPQKNLVQMCEPVGQELEISAEIEIAEPICINKSTSLVKAGEILPPVMHNYQSTEEKVNSVLPNTKPSKLECHKPVTRKRNIKDKSGDGFYGKKVSLGKKKGNGDEEIRKRVRNVKSKMFRSLSDGIKTLEQKPEPSIKEALRKRSKKNKNSSRDTVVDNSEKIAHEENVKICDIIKLIETGNLEATNTSKLKNLSETKLHSIANLIKSGSKNVEKSKSKKAKNRTKRGDSSIIDDKKSDSATTSSNVTSVFNKAKGKKVHGENVKKLKRQKKTNDNSYIEDNKDLVVNGFELTSQSVKSPRSCAREKVKKSKRKKNSTSNLLNIPSMKEHLTSNTSSSPLHPKQNLTVMTIPIEKSAKPPGKKKGKRHIDDSSLPDNLPNLKTGKTYSREKKRSELSNEIKFPIKHNEIPDKFAISEIQGNSKIQLGMQSKTYHKSMDNDDKIIQRNIEDLQNYLSSKQMSISSSSSRSTSSPDVEANLGRERCILARGINKSVDEENLQDSYKQRGPSKHELMDGLIDRFFNITHSLFGME